MASSRLRKDVEEISGDDEEEEEIFSVSGRQGMSYRRGSQCSHFGAVDENIELRINTQGKSDTGKEQTSRGETSRASYKPENHREDEFDPTSYQGGTNGAHPPTTSGSQRAQEMMERVDALLSLIGLGKFHWLVLVVCGCGLFHASFQLGFVGILMPDIARDLCLSDASTGWLRGSVFVGVIFVSVLWGCAADLRCRRVSLGVCLATTGIATALAACFSQSRAALLAFLIIASLGAGGVISIPFAYVYEFLPRRTAQRMTCALLVFTVFGAMFVPLVAPAFASSFTGLVTSEDVSPNAFANWRIFCLVVSLLPVASALLVLSILPESPYLLLERRQWARAIQTLTQMYSYNHGESGVEMFKDRANGLYRLKRLAKDRQVPAPSTPLQSCMRTLYLGIKNITAVLNKTTLVLALGAFSLTFGYCAWTLWLSDFIIAEGLKYVVNVTSNATFSNETITVTLEKQTFINATFDSVTFLNVRLRDVSCSDCTFSGCAFENVVSEATIFTRCLFVDTSFRNTDFQPRQFADGTELVNSTLERVAGRGCALDVPFAPARAYWQIMFGQSGGLLGLLLSVLVTGVIGTRRLCMCGALVVAVTVLLGLFSLTGWAAAALLFILQVGGFMAWGALIVQSAKSFPIHKRATGLCLLLSVVTTGGLLGFVVVVALPQIADVIVTVVVVLAGTVCSYFLQRHSQE